MEEKECWLIRPASARLVEGHFSTVPHYISTTVYFVKNGIILICVYIYFQMLLLVTRDFRALGSESRFTSWTLMASWPYYRAVSELLFCGCIFFTLHSSNCHSHQWGPCKVHWTEKRHLKFPGFAFIHLHMSQFVMQHEALHSTTDRSWNPDGSNPLLSLALRFHINWSYMRFLQAIAGHWSMPYGTVVNKFVWSVTMNWLQPQV